jgi:CheY-like chemotaxis protein
MGLRALVFDDEECIRSMLASLLTEEGCDVCTFDDPSSFAFTLHNGCTCDFEHACADILISDVYMPHVSGVQFIEALKASGCSIPFMALMSGNWAAADLNRAKTLGLQIFDKPFKLRDFRLWLERCREKISKNRVLCDVLHQGDMAVQKQMAVRPRGLHI